MGGTIGDKMVHSSFRDLNLNAMVIAKIAINKINLERIMMFMKDQADKKTSVINKVKR